MDFDGALCSPARLLAHLTAAGNLYVTEKLMHRVLRFPAEFT